MSTSVLALLVGCGGEPAEPDFNREQPSTAEPTANTDVVAANSNGTQSAAVGANQNQQFGSKLPQLEAKRAIETSLAPHLLRSTKGLTAKAGPHGTRRIALQGRFSSAKVAESLPDGSVRTKCVTSAAELKAVLYGEERTP